MSTATHDIVAKLWNLCNVLKDGGVTFHEYVIELTYLLFLKMAKETLVESQIPSGYRWDDLTNKAAPEQLAFYKQLLSHLVSHCSTLVQEIFADASSSIKKPSTLSTLVIEIDKLDWYSARKEDFGDVYEGLLEKNAKSPYHFAFAVWNFLCSGCEDERTVFYSREEGKTQYERSLGLRSAR